MAFETRFDISPYFDDFDAAKQFLKVLYRPNVAVQTRELNQMQTIIQHQIGYMGSHVFDNGSVVIGGGITRRPRFPYVAIGEEVLDNNGDPTDINPDDIIGDLIGQTATVYQSSGTLSAVIHRAESATSTDPTTLFVEYVNGDQTRAAEFQAGDQLEFDDTGYKLNVTDAGAGFAITVEKGVYFVDGYFHFVPTQTLILDKFSSTPTASVGLRIDSDVVTPTEDESLLDNAGGTSQFGAPGAHRFRVILQLESRELSVDDPGLLAENGNFIQLVRIRNGEIQRVVRGSSYNVLDTRLAQQVYDQSGHFAVELFNAVQRPHLKESGNNGVFTAANGGSEDKFVTLLDAGSIYAYGYNVRREGTTILEHDRARGSDHVVTETNATSTVEYGNWAWVDMSTGGYMATIGDVVEIHDSDTEQIGTARIRHIKRGIVDGVVAYRVYLYRISMNAGKSFATDSAALFTTGLDKIGDFVTSPVGLNDQSQNALIFQLPYDTVESVGDLTYTTTRSYQNTATSTGVTFNIGTGLTFDNPMYLFDVTSGAAYDPQADVDITVTGGFGNSTVTFEGTPIVDGNTFRLVSAIFSTNDGTRTKTRQNSYTETLTGVRTALENGEWVTLANTDVIQVQSIKTDAGAGVDITDNFEVDNGQRDNVYNYGRIRLKTGRSIPSDSEYANPNDLEIVYDYYAHGVGQYFTVNSYSEPIDEIPTHTTSSGDKIALSDAIDFRPSVDGPSSFESAPTPSTLVVGDISHYIGRYDNIVANIHNDIYVQRGQPSRNPNAPEPGTDAIALHQVYVPPFTFNVEDVDLERQEFERYTMEDIGRLENRIENLEEEVILNKLETDTDALNIETNAAGQTRLKNGFIVDPLTDHSIAANDHNEYSVAVDFDEQTARPQPYTAHVLSSAAPDANIKVHDNGIITLDYSEAIIASQGQATSDVSVNPFLTFYWNGSLNLQPSSDTWVDTQRAPSITTTRVEETAAFRRAQRTNTWGTVWNNWGGWFGRGWRWSWRRRRRTETFTRTETNRTTEVISRDSIPFIRSRNVTLTADGLRPNATHYVFFDGEDVTGYCSQTSTPAPSGAHLLTDVDGNVEATLTIPNNNDLRFRTGARQVTIVDEDELKDLNISEASSTYTAEGTTVTRQTTIESVRTRDARTTTTWRRLTWGNFLDPIAQSFMVEETGGAFITSVDVSFTEKDEQKPVYVILVETDNGYPTQNQLPMGQAMQVPSQVNADNTDFVWTTFTFPAPIYVQEGTEYAFIIYSDSEKYRVRYAQMGERDVRTDQAIAKQPHSGIMFKSANSSTWTAYQEADVTFRINRADFVNSGNVTFEPYVSPGDDNVQSNPFKQELPENPLTVRDGTNWVLVTHYNHGLVTGDTATLEGVKANLSDDTVNRIPITELNGDHQVHYPDTDFYFIQTTTSAVGNSVGGGNEVIGIGNVAYDIIAPKAEVQNPDKSDIDWIATTITQAGRTTASSAIEVNANTTLDQTGVLTRDDTTTELVGTMRTTNSSISPVIDGERVGWTLIRNRINDPSSIKALQDNSTGPYQYFDVYRDETQQDSSSIAKYFTRIVRLDSNANSLRVMIDADIPSSYITVDAYFRIQLPDDEQPLIDQGWRELPVDGTIRTSSDGEFYEVSFDSAQLDSSEWVKGPEEMDSQELPEYQAVQIKLVMQYNNAPDGSIDTANVPEIARIRALALST